MKHKEFNQKTPERKLGQGISALIGKDRNPGTMSIIQEGSKTPKELVQNIKVTKIVAGVYQPRTHFEDSALKDLAQSIKENGVIQPIVVREIRGEDKYEIIAGERRFRASQLAKMKEVPVIIKKINNHQALEMAIIENVQRQDLTVIEEAKGYKKLTTEFAYSQEQIANRIGKSRSHVTNLLRLLQLPDSVQELVNDELLTMGHARALLSCQNPEEIAQEILSKSLNVREVESLVRTTRPHSKKTHRNNSASQSSEALNLSNAICEIIKMPTKIKYNKRQNSGCLSIDFGNIDDIKELTEILRKGYESQ